MGEIQGSNVMKSVAKEIAEDIFRRKQASRHQAAQLPIEEKLRILVQLQKQADEIRRATGRPEILVWKLDA